MTNSRGRPPHKDKLTPAEWRTADAVRHGLSNQQIANLENISLDGVKYHVANAIAKLNLKNRKALKNWVGAPVDSPLSKEVTTMKQQFKVIGLGQVSRSVKNIVESERWYRDVLGLTHLYTFGTMAFFDCSGTRLMLSEKEEVQSAESILYLRVSNIIVAYEKMKELGITFVSAPHMIHKHEDGTEEWMAFFDDLENRPLAIMSSESKT